MAKNYNYKPEKGENANALKHTMKLAKLPLIDTKDPNEVAERIELYFETCIEDDLRPSVAGLGVALGVNRQTIFSWQKGNTTPEVTALIERAIAILNADQEELIANANNIVGNIFLMKNSFEDYTDRREVIHKVETRQLTQAELLERAKALPDYEES